MHLRCFLEGLSSRGKGENRREVIRGYLAQLSQLFRDGYGKDSAGSR